MIQGKWFAPGSDLSDVIPVRMAVFGRGSDDRDAISWNVLVFEDSAPVAVGRIWWEDGFFRLGDIGVLEGRRNRRLGDLVLRLLLFKAQNHAAREVRLYSPLSVSGFFERLGFRSLPSGGSASVEMILAGDRIDLDTCKNCSRNGCPNRKE